MTSYTITGGRPLCGECRVQGSKNSSLPVLAAALLSAGVSEINNCPEISDIDATLKILNKLGCKTFRSGSTVTVDSTDACGNDIPDELMHEMRSSVIFLGAILARMGRVKLSHPGGCEIGERPIDLHLDAMRKLGATVKEEAGTIECSAPGGLKGADIVLSFPSVGATENAVIAASTAEGFTTITNAAMEPEIKDLADFLNACGAEIIGAGEKTICIRGVKKLHGASHRIIPDRIVAATLMAGAAMTRGKLTLTDMIPQHLIPVTSVLKEMGCVITGDSDHITLTAPSRLNRVGNKIITMPYPGFPTDAQAQIAAALCVADGTSVLVEKIFENRFRYACELKRFGAKITTEGQTAVIEGVNRLIPARAVSPDLRGGAALLLAGFTAEGVSVITDDGYIERGYEAPEKLFGSINGMIKRTDDNG